MDHRLLCCYDSLALIKVRIYRDSEHSMLCAYSCYESHTEHIYKIWVMKDYVKELFSLQDIGLYSVVPKYRCSSTENY